MILNWEARILGIDILPFIHMWEREKPQQHSKHEFEPASIAHKKYLSFH